MRYPAQIVHHIPGRLRIKLPQAKGNHALMRRINESLSPHEGIRRVETNAMTGSVLIQYDPHIHQEYENKLATHAANENLFTVNSPPEVTEFDEKVNKFEAEAEFLSEHSDTARAIVNAVKQLNETIKYQTNNLVDLNVLVPLVAAAFSVTEIGLYTATPLWVTLGIFSFNSFVNLHRPQHQQPLLETHEVTINHPPRRAKTARKRAVKNEQNGN